MKWFLVLVIGQFLCAAIAQVSLFPEVIVTTPNDAVSSSYSCVSPVDPITEIQWLLNNTLLEDLNLTDVTTAFAGVAGSLTFSNPSDYNVTSVTCRAELLSGEQGNATALLLVQGLLDAVSTLNSIANSTLISLTWEPPFTLDITNVDPDITGYCVDVVNSSSSETLHSECVITETEFSYLIPNNSHCYNTTFSFSITPLNIVGRGEIATKEHRVATNRPSKVKVLCMPSESASELTAYDVTFSYVIVMSAPVCSSDLTFMNIDSGDSFSIQPDESISEEITFDSQQLMTNSRYRVRISATNVMGSAISYTNISTHDIEGAVLIADNDTVDVSIDYHIGSNATGALLNFVYKTNSGDIDFSRSVIIPVNRIDTEDNTLPARLYSGQYVVFFHDIERSGALLSGLRYPAVRSELQLDEFENDEQEITSNFELCSYNTSFPLIIVECDFSTNSTATAFQLIAQPTDLNQYRLYVSESVDPHTTASVNVSGPGQYRVFVLPIFQVTGITESSVVYSETVVVTESMPTDMTEEEGVPIIAAAIGAVAGVIVTITVVILLLCVLVKVTRKKKGLGEHTFTSSSSVLGQSRIQTATILEVHLEANVPQAEQRNEASSNIYTEMSAEGDEGITSAQGSSSTPSIEMTQIPADTLDDDNEAPPLPPPYASENKSEEEKTTEDSSQQSSPAAVAETVHSEGTTEKDHEIQYAPISHPGKPSGVDPIEDHLQYSTIAGCKNPKQKGVYAFIKPTKTSTSTDTHQVSRGIIDDVIYSDVLPPTKVHKKRKKSPPPPPIPEKRKVQEPSASTSGDNEQAKLPPEKGAQVDLQGEKGVIHASEEGGTEVAKLSLENGAQVDLRDCSASPYGIPVEETVTSYTKEHIDDGAPAQTDGAIHSIMEQTGPAEVRLTAMENEP